MKELSLNILDIAQNSVKAGASLITILLTEDDEKLIFRITDNGCGMKADFLANVTDPFTTTRTTRRVGLGLPLLKMEAEMTGGSLTVTSRHESEYEDHGTELEAVFYKSSIDYTPLGDIVGSICTLVQGLGKIDLSFCHTVPEGEIRLDTREMREILGDVPLDCPEIIDWAKEYLLSQYEEARYRIIKME